MHRREGPPERAHRDRAHGPRVKPRVRRTRRWAPAGGHGSARTRTPRGLAHPPRSPLAAARRPRRRCSASGRRARRAALRRDRSRARRRGHRRGGPIPPGTPTGLTPRVDAQGRTVLYEKDVNLDIAVRLHAVAARPRRAHAADAHDRTSRAATGPHHRVRADLKARTDIANEADVNVFVSIHNNALRHDHERHRDVPLLLLERRVAAAGGGRCRRQVVAALGLPGPRREDGGLLRPAPHRDAGDPRRGRVPHQPGRGAAAGRPGRAPARSPRPSGAASPRYAAGGVAAPPTLPPTIGPWKTRPARIPAGYRLVKTGRDNPVGRGGWLA